MTAEEARRIAKDLRSLLARVERTAEALLARYEEEATP